MSFFVHTYFCHQKIEGEIIFNGSRLSPCRLNENPYFQKKKKKKFFFEDWDFFSKLGKSHLNSVGNRAKFDPENTKKSLNSIYLLIQNIKTP